MPDDDDTVHTFGALIERWWTVLMLLADFLKSLWDDIRSWMDTDTNADDDATRLRNEDRALYRAA